MLDERQQELAALRALDLLDGAERTAFDAELARDAELRDLVSELRETTADFALTAPQVTPPAELRARVLETIAAAPQPETRNADRQTLNPGPAAPRSKLIAFSPLIPWAIAASLAIVSAWLGQLYLASRTENALLHDQQALADLAIIGARHQVEAERILAQRQIADDTRHISQLDQQIQQSTRQLADAQQELAERSARLVAEHAEAARLHDQVAAAAAAVSDLREKLKTQGDVAQFKIATLASLAGNSPQALAVAVWNPSTQQGVLRVQKLPALASNKDYQLWLIDPAYSAPVDGGVFTVDPATGDARIIFKPHRPVNNATKFAVSLERKGGVPKAEGPIMLVGD